MQVNTKGIVLSALKYGDTSLIVRIYTLSDGLKAYLLRGVLSSKKGKIKTGYFQPLTQLELVASHKNKGTLERLTEVKVTHHYSTLHTDMAKNAIVLFLSEMLTHSIHEEEANSELFSFLETALQWLDAQDKVANFHLLFLLQLTKYLGFYPDVKEQDAPYFDMQNGCFTFDIGDATINGENLIHFKRLLGINFEALPTLVLSKTNRQELLQTLILYFQVHVQGFRKPKSLAILNQVFS